MTNIVEKNKINPMLNSNIIRTIIRYSLIFFVAFFLFGVILVIAGKDPIEAIKDTLAYTLGTTAGFSEVIVKMIPLLFTAVAVALPARVGLINVGAEGQLFIGALFSTGIALAFPNWPIWLLLPAMIVMGLLGGAAWAFIPVFLRARGLVNETITTLLMNYVAPTIVSFFVYGSWRTRANAMYPQTDDFSLAARLPTFFGTRIHLGLVIALVILLIYWYVMKYSRWGLEMKAIGGNPQAARRNGIRWMLYLIVVMCIGGAIAGLAGMSEISGIHGRLRPNFSPGFGFMGFLISWLSNGNPVGIFMMSFVIAIITSGGDILQIKQGLPFAVVNILMAITLYVVLARPKPDKKEIEMTLLALLGVLSSAIFTGTSLLYTTLGEVISERAGIVNLGLEGVMLVSAAVGFAVGTTTGNPYLAVLASMLTGGLMNLIFGYMVISRKANQLASGLATMFFGFGLSALIGKPYVGGKINSLPRILIPGLGGIPAQYTSQLQFDILIYLVVPAALGVWFLLFRTRWGLGLRAIGENPDTAFAAGRNPNMMRFQALFLAGMLAGLGAAHLCIVYTRTWKEFMTAGRGFIAVALVIFSKWHPIRAIAGALLFGGAVAFQLLLQSMGVNVSPFLLDATPYVLTILVLIVWGGTRKQSAPAGLGRVYYGTE